MSTKPSVIASLLVLVCSTSSSAAELALPRDGWVSWQISAIDAAADRCCFENWQGRNATRMTCRLDADAGGFNIGNRGAVTGAVKVYARLAAGKVELLQALSASCPVETRTTIQDLGEVGADDSARWLAAQVQQRGADARDHRLGEHALAALAMHPGETASTALVGFVRDDARVEIRKSAVFWLAQSASSEADQTIAAALRKDADASVREHAVFALSQLPEDRAVRALITTAEDRSLSREQRKRAVFWLAQSEARAATDYLDQVLARSAR
jgi:hypothetical protein